MRAVFRSALAGAAVVALVATSVSCGDRVRQGRAPVFVVIDRIEVASGATPDDLSEPVSDAVRAFSESLQGDLDDSRILIHTHAICPDGVDTGMVRERQGDEEAAIIFSAPRLLRPEEVAQRIGEVIGKRKPLVAIPTSRMVITGTMALFPNLSLRVLPLFKKQGERKRAQA